MIKHPLLDILYRLGLRGMAKALDEQLQLAEVGSLTFEERLSLLLDREQTERDNRHLQARLKRALLRETAACVEDIIYSVPRGLDKSLVTKLATLQWVREHHNLLVLGPTGIGKTWLGCALANQACRNGFTAIYKRLPTLFQALSLAKGDGSYAKLLKGLAKTDLLYLDDFGLAPLTDEQRHDLLEIIEERYKRRSTLIASQLPLDHWHTRIGDPTLADAILDRIAHNAYKITLQGESMRKKLNKD